ncbi:TPA: hypothetical protein ACH6J2_002501, partial [Enterococcus faecium]
DKLNIANLVFELLRKYSNDFIEKCNASEKNRLIDLIFYACLGDITLCVLLIKDIQIPFLLESFFFTSV